jgi:hypothetical protein
VSDLLLAQIIVAGVAAFFAGLVLSVFIDAWRHFWFGWWR